ncbi:hypothetical protein [Dyella caseinilytica]|uniref:DUF4087 domain-containing protein n=1 Tax=Dyella caseinilytica TaxID=1849581 RepID=A0ABX7GWI0_9GAMM|nr:hypothetical protein [Dyella caseinilytica]QRN54847.1 hypothetical protein ISN74_05695 [Dyella caseinilytica]GFZ97352.1 hypothetical protein GCM10011408_17270 [Dyella caseinilytica]
MRNLWMILALFMIDPCAANASTHYWVHLQGSKQPYICVQCDLRTPYPDPKTLATVTAWQQGKPPFEGGTGHSQAAHSLEAGDVVNICNGCGCATYTLDNDGIWGMGDFQAKQEHPANMSPATSKKEAVTSSVSG